MSSDTLKKDAGEPRTPGRRNLPSNQRDFLRKSYTDQDAKDSPHGHEGFLEGSKKVTKQQKTGTKPSIQTQQSTRDPA